MQTVTNQIKQSMAGSSWIRKMFEKGIELKKQHGADAVCDFSLGNPDVPPPAKTKEVLEAIAAPAILHFWGPKKPWRPSHRPYRKLYHAAMRAVGLPVPREQVLAPWYNLVNALNLRRIKGRITAALSFTGCAEVGGRPEPAPAGC